MLGFSLALHVLFLLLFGGVTIFRGSVPKMPFASQNIAADPVEETTAPPAEAEPSTGEELTMESSRPPTEDSPETETVPPVDLLSSVGGAGWVPSVPGGAAVSESGMTGALATAKPGQGSGRSLKAGSSFFGIQIEQESPRVILLLDTSNTMFARKRGAEMHTFDYGEIKEEAVKLVKSLDESASFNVVLFEGGALAFRKAMLPATEGMKQQASRWIREIDENPEISIGKRRGEEKLMEGGGTRLDTGFKLSFRYDPTTVFVLTDGEANLRTEQGSKKITTEQIVSLVRELQEKQKTPAVIHVIHYQTSQTRASETAFLKGIATQGRGQWRAVEAKTLRTEKQGEEKPGKAK